MAGRRIVTHHLSLLVRHVERIARLSTTSWFQRLDVEVLGLQSIVELLQANKIRLNVLVLNHEAQGEALKKETGLVSIG